MSNKAVVILSGGQDSTTCLFWAKLHFSELYAITFDYEQRHDAEIASAVNVSKRAGIKPENHKIVTLGPVLGGTSPLVNKDEKVGHYAAVNQLPGGIEPTFIPARNILFITLAANYAACVGANHLVTGVCEEDYGGYPDCRQAFITAMSEAISEGVFGTRNGFKIYTPLMTLTKKATVELAVSLGEDCLQALAYSHTCYDGCYPPNPRNHASLLRAKGFAEAGVSDPLILRAKDDGLLPHDYPNTGLVEGTKYADWEPSGALFDKQKASEQ